MRGSAGVGGGVVAAEACGAAELAMLAGGGPPGIVTGTGVGVGRTTVGGAPAGGAGGAGGRGGSGTGAARGGAVAVAGAAAGSGGGGTVSTVRSRWPLHWYQPA